MTSATEIDLRRNFTAEERDALLDAIAGALKAGDDEEANRW